MRKPPICLAAVVGVLLDSQTSIATHSYTSTSSKAFANAALIEMRLCTS